jgi:hypothetical protein
MDMMASQSSEKYSLLARHGKLWQSQLTKP